jgi:hypothetical protein
MMAAQTRLVPSATMRAGSDLTTRRLALLGSLVALLGLVGASCGTSSEGAGGTPGYDDSPRVISTEPFEMPGQGDGPTTIPEGFFEEHAARTSTTTAPPPTTTTTTSVDFLAPDLAPRIPELQAIRDICGFELDIGPFQQILTLSPAETKDLMEGVVPMLARYEQVAPEAARGDLAALQQAFQRLVDVLSANGWDPRSEAFTAVVADIGAAAGDPTSLGGRLTRVVQVERIACR